MMNRQDLAHTRIDSLLPYITADDGYEVSRWLDLVSVGRALEAMSDPATRVRIIDKGSCRHCLRGTGRRARVSSMIAPHICTYADRVIVQIQYASGKAREVRTGSRPWEVWNLERVNGLWLPIERNEWYTKWVEDKLPAINAERQDMGLPAWDPPLMSKHCFQAAFELGYKIRLPMKHGKLVNWAETAISRGLLKTWNEIGEPQ